MGDTGEPSLRRDGRIPDGDRPENRAQLQAGNLSGANVGTPAFFGRCGVSFFGLFPTPVCRYMLQALVEGYGGGNHGQEGEPAPKKQGGPTARAGPPRKGKSEFVNHPFSLTHSTGCGSRA